MSSSAFPIVAASVVACCCLSLAASAAPASGQDAVPSQQITPSQQVTPGRPLAPAHQAGLVQDAVLGQQVIVASASLDASALPTDAAGMLDQEATLLSGVAAVSGGLSSAATASGGALGLVSGGPKQWTSPEGLSSSLQIMLLLTVLSLAPAILLMTTCYVRIIIVLGLLRQAIGLQSLPPSQVMTSIALFMTLFVMLPVWTQVYEQAIRPYTDPGTEMELTEAWEAGARPIRDFMAHQIDVAGNHEDVLLFYRYAAPDAEEPETFDDVPLRALLPAYMLSELKTAFLMGFQIYLPFLIVDLVVASVTISMGMLMLPPAVISLPFKLLLFVLVDGWRLVVQMLMDSFGTLAG